jgi:hypothetical protein
MPDDSGKQREIVDQQARFPFASSMSKLGDQTKLLDLGAHLLIVDVKVHLLQVCASNQNAGDVNTEKDLQ